MAVSVHPFVDIQTRTYAQAGAGLRAAFPPHLAMDAATMADFLDRHVYAVLATGRRDGRPHAAPIAFSVWDGGVWIATLESVRLRNLRRLPYASLVIAEGDARSRHRTLIAEGPTTIHEGLDILDGSADFSAAWRKRHDGAPDWAVAMIELRPDKVFSFDGPLEARAHA
jgi:hypothetical protein